MNGEGALPGAPTPHQTTPINLADLRRERAQNTKKAVKRSETTVLTARGQGEAPQVSLVEHIERLEELDRKAFDSGPRWAPLPSNSSIREVLHRIDAAGILLLRILHDPESAPPSIIVPSVTKLLKEAELWLAGERGHDEAL